MKISIRGEKIKLTAAIEDFAKEKLSKLERYFGGQEEITVTVVIKVRKEFHKVEITIPYKQFIIRVEEKQEDVYAAIDVAIDKLERQIIKHKSKIEDRYKKNRKDKKDVLKQEFTPEEDLVIKRKLIDLKPMSEEEAALQMEVIGHEFYLFKDAITMEVKLIYKRKEKGYGIIEIA